MDCRRYNCNFLLNTGLLGNGSVNPMDACMLKEIDKWIRKNEKAVYEVKSCDITATNAMILQGNGEYYAVIKNVPMYADPNVQRVEWMGQVCIDADILSAEWLDNGEKIELEDNSFYVKPYLYGESYSLRVAKFTAK